MVHVTDNNYQVDDDVSLRGINTSNKKDYTL